MAEIVPPRSPARLHKIIWRNPQLQADIPVTVASALSGAFLHGPWPDPLAHPPQHDGFEVPLTDRDVVSRFAQVTMPGSLIYVRVTVRDGGCVPPHDRDYAGYGRGPAGWADVLRMSE